MQKPFVFLTIGLISGTGLGFLLAAGSTVARKSLPAPEPAMMSSVHDHSAHDHGEIKNHHRLTEALHPSPSLVLDVYPDGPQSRNLRIGVTGFNFAPEASNGPHVPGQGHAHIYINDIKVARAYCPWVQLDALPKGRHRIRVTLNANDHSVLAVDGQPIEATTEVVIE